MSHPNSMTIRRGVIGIVERGAKLLVIRRAVSVPKGGAWCFPGGHIEPGENSRAAVIRELSEELSIQVQPIQRLGAVRVADSRHILAVWRVKHTAGQIRANWYEVAESKWMTPQELRNIERGLPSNNVVLDMLASTFVR